ncbi:phage tail terminator protein [Lelliottia sp. V89_10]|uniref:phage tail terminator protein n=1 Tax=Lelliottia wanjuensis TaxID=3050585 RepID=UPI00249DD8B3|nr:MULTISPECIES: phage tail terminator protein [unclassified Lelliottia]MDI3359775.1 phage tail terminator protein [Lelliottia sp. V89_13]MDK9548733.1 phage tail terminator protein [Lelliottia sp. V89_5]MDK9597365.1 phage tail terminator protein [Lelliottia sp. V89_10]
MKNPQIRAAILAALKSNITTAKSWFDGRPGFVSAKDDLPGVAVYITDAQYTGAELDEDLWTATLHVEVFLKAESTDSELDAWMEQYIYPALNDVPGLDELVQNMVPQGYDYHRDDEAMEWGSADLTYSIDYVM